MWYEEGSCMQWCSFYVFYKNEKQDKRNFQQRGYT